MEIFDRKNSIKRFGRVTEVMAPPNLMELQTKSFTKFLQADIPADEREEVGLERILREIFPVESYEGRNRLVLFGGHDDTALGNNNDIWTFDLAAQSWTRAPGGDAFNAPACMPAGECMMCNFPSDFTIFDAASPERRESQLFAILGDSAIMYGGRTDCGLAKDTWSLDLGSLTWTQHNESPLGMTCFRSGSLNCEMAGARMCI